MSVPWQIYNYCFFHRFSISFEIVSNDMSKFLLLRDSGLRGEEQEGAAEETNEGAGGGGGGSP
jgi:hypothetical protein